MRKVQFFPNSVVESTTPTRDQMTQSQTQDPSQGTMTRRRFLAVGAGFGAGLTLGVYLPGCGRAKEPQPKTPESLSSSAQAGPGKAGGEVVSEAQFEPNAFVRIGSDNSVTVIMKHLEMGQGTYTGLATLVAEELDASWEQIKVQAAPADAKLYNNLFWGPVQGTGGSTAIANSFTQMRKAGATARYMLVTAAAKKWNVPAGEITVQDGVLQHIGSNNSASFGELAALAAQEPVPEEVFVKEPEEFRIIGTKLPRKDSVEKINGQATFTLDVKLPGMLTAVVAHAPRFDATLKTFDATEAKKIKGVQDVVALPTGVAVVAKDFWSAKKGRDALRIEWDESAAFALNSDQILADYKNQAQNPGVVARHEGDAAQVLPQAAKTLEASYAFPYLAHAAMEPMNCVVQFDGDRAQIWNGEQFQTLDQAAAAKVLGIAPEQVQVNMLYAGGSFGRRANPHSDFVTEAAHIAKAINGKAPVKMVWTREDDMRAGYYRPLFYHQVKAGLDGNGNLLAWEHRIVGQSIIAGTAFEGGLVKNGVDQTSVEGVSTMPYAIANIHVDLHSPVLPVPVQWWRSVGSTHTAFVVETFIDELARAANKDPLEFRRALLKDHPRHLGVLELAVEKAQWDKPLAAGRGRGLALHESFNTYVAQVAEISLHPDKTFSVDRVVIAVDCGIAVNPDIIRAQMEGGMGFGLSAALASELTLKDGAVEQSNFHDYTVLRINQMPQVEVHIVNSAQPPSGVGEPATPVIAPAVANALAQVTGKRFYKLPLPVKV